MKNVFWALFACTLLVFTGPAWSYSVYDPPVDVGGIDKFLTKDIVSSGDADELAWVNDYLTDNGYITTPYSSFVKTDFVENDPILDPDVYWVKTNESATVYAAKFPSAGEPEFYFIKVGAKPDAPDHLLFQNVAEFNWAVIDLAATGVEIKNIGKFSHMGEFGVAVPEPATIILLGLGLFGLASLRRKF